MERALTRTLLSTLFAVLVTDAALADLTTTQKGSKLKVKGDSGSDSIQLDGTGLIGRVVVSQAGNNPQPFLGVFDIEIVTGEGNDQVFVNGIQIGGSLTVATGDGADSVDIDNTRLDSVSVPLMIGRNVTLNLGGEAGDQVDIDTENAVGFMIGGNLAIDGAADIDIRGDGVSANFEVEDISIGGDLRIKVGRAVDVNTDGVTIDLRNLNVGGATKMRLSNRTDDAGNDVVRIARSTFVRDVELSLRAGNDVVDFDAQASRFSANLSVDGSSGADLLLDPQFVTFGGVTKFKAIENQP